LLAIPDRFKKIAGCCDNGQAKPFGPVSEDLGRGQPMVFQKLFYSIVTVSKIRCKVNYAVRIGVAEPNGYRKVDLPGVETLLHRLLS
jgi:hypothetical protein